MMIRVVGEQGVAGWVQDLADVVFGDKVLATLGSVRVDASKGTVALEVASECHHSGEHVDAAPGVRQRHVDAAHGGLRLLGHPVLHEDEALGGCCTKPGSAEVTRCRSAEVLCR